MTTRESILALYPKTTQARIAQILQLAPSTVAWHLDKAGVRGSPQTRIAAKAAQRARVLEAFGRHCSIRGTARELGLAQSTIRSHVLRAGRAILEGRAPTSGRPPPRQAPSARVRSTPIVVEAFLRQGLSVEQLGVAMGEIAIGHGTGRDRDMRAATGHPAGSGHPGTVLV